MSKPYTTAAPRQVRCTKCGKWTPKDEWYNENGRCIGCPWCMHGQEKDPKAKANENDWSYTDWRTV